MAETVLTEPWQPLHERVGETAHWYRMTEVNVGLRAFLVFAGLVAAMLAIDTISVWMLMSLKPEAVDASSDWAFCWYSVFAVL
jgi:hypothetical protein